LPLLRYHPAMVPPAGLTSRAAPSSGGMSILSKPCTGSPSRHWTARFEAARPGARGSTRSRPSCGRPVSRFRRSNGRGRLSRGGGCTPSRASRWRSPSSRRSGCRAPPGDATGDEAMGVYSAPRLRSRAPRLRRAARRRGPAHAGRRPAVGSLLPMACALSYFFRSVTARVATPMASIVGIASTLTSLKAFKASERARDSAVGNGGT